MRKVGKMEKNNKNKAFILYKSTFSSEIYVFGIIFVE